jgi:hypothetical protein
MARAAWTRVGCAASHTACTEGAGSALAGGDALVRAGQHIVLACCQHLAQLVELPIGRLALPVAQLRARVPRCEVVVWAACACLH